MSSIISVSKIVDVGLHDCVNMVTRSLQKFMFLSIYIRITYVCVLWLCSSFIHRQKT